MELFIIIFIITLIVIFKINAPKIKGFEGEFKIAFKLKKLNKEEYKVLNNILIKIDKRISQIDHVIVSIYGIFVIETKNYKGWIHGHEKSEYWTQTIFNDRYQFRNPIKQNWSHIHTLKVILSDFCPIQFYPIVVFTGEAELKNIYSDLPVIYSNELYNTIIEKSQKPIMTMSQVNAISSKINNLNIFDKKVRKEHIHHIKDDIFKREENESNFICPRCGGNLKIKYGKFGKFYGCSNYPNCKYTKNL